MKNKSAFTMIELVFVIIVLGILASLAMGRMERDLKQEASETILSHIRLAQQLALSDNKHLDNSITTDRNKWQDSYWRFEFSNCEFDGDVKPIYAVGSGKLDNGDLSKERSAINPVNGKYLFGSCTASSNASDVSEDVFAGQHFGIKNMKLTRCYKDSDTTPRGGHFGFDYLGRLHVAVGSYDNIGTDYFDEIATRDCNLTVTMSDETTFSIIIENETGHSYIEGQDNS